jgi:hypothetical protein
MDLPASGIDLKSWRGLYLDPSPIQNIRTRFKQTIWWFVKTNSLKRATDCNGN